MSTSRHTSFSLSRKPALPSHDQRRFRNVSMASISDALPALRRSSSILFLRLSSKRDHPTSEEAASPRGAGLGEHLHDFCHPGAGLEVDGLLLAVGGQANHLRVLLDGALVVAEAAVIDLALAELRLDVHRIELEDLVEEDHRRVEAVLFQRDAVAKAVERDQLVLLRIDPRARQVSQDGGKEPVLRRRIRALYFQSRPHAPPPIRRSLIYPTY